MKKSVIKLENALSLDKETISRLNEDQLNQLVGGMVAAGIHTNTCNGSDLQPTYVTCEACSCNGQVGTVQ